MVIFIKSDGNGRGDAQIITPEVVYQGSDNVTDIIVIAPYSAQTQMSIGFKLPNGKYWFAPPVNASDPRSGGNYAPMSFVKQDFTTKANVWQYTLPRSVTEMAGEVKIAINAVSRRYSVEETPSEETPTVITGNCTSYECGFTVSESVVPSLDPDDPPADVYELLRQYLAELDGRTAIMPNMVAGVEKTAPNAFRTVTLGGSKGAEVVLENDLGTPLAPVGAASTLNIAGTKYDPATQKGAWVEKADGSGYTTVIPAAMHMQMRDGATARDLWLGFDNVTSDTLTGVYQGYTVNENGDITITATVPVAMTVRVWNGKGLNSNNIENITPAGTDANGGNIYDVTLTNGEVYKITAPKGSSGELQVGTVKQVGYNEPLKVENSGTSTDAVFDFEIPQGKPAFVNIGKVVTLPPESEARVENVGTENDPIFDFYLPEGIGFRISKTYPSVGAMNAGFATDGVPLYGFVIINTGNVEDEDNAKLYMKTATEYSYLSDLSGAQGIVGPRGERGYTGVGISKVTAQYAINDSSQIVPTTWSDNRPTASLKGKYLWVKLIVSFNAAGYTPAEIPFCAYSGDDGLSVTSATVIDETQSDDGYTVTRIGFDVGTGENTTALAPVSIRAKNGESGGADPATPTTLGTVYGVTTTTNTAIGHNVKAGGTNAVVFGQNANVSYGNGVAIGASAVVYGYNAVAVGRGTQAYSNATAMGSNARAQFTGVALGCYANVRSRYAIAIGSDSNVNGNYATALGYGAKADGVYSVALGQTANASGDYTVALGFGAWTNVCNSIVLGNPGISSLRCAVQTITSLSDERTKEDIQLANTAQCLVDVERLPVKRFKFKKWARPNPLDVHRTGFIAQDVEKVFPKDVQSDRDDFPVLDEDGKPVMIDELDENGNIVYEDVLDENGERIVESETTDENGETVTVYKQQPHKVEKKFTIEDCKKISMADGLPTLWGAVQYLSQQLKETRAELEKVKAFVNYTEASEVTE